MGLNSSGPISLGGTTAGQSIAVELGGTGTAQISLNCTSVRTLAGVPSGAIVMPTNFYGKSNSFTYTVSANQTNFCMRAGAVTAGWNGSSALVVNINSGVIISANSTGANAMTISGSFPAGVTVNNSGTIVGMGGGGGTGGSYCGGAGVCGGTALKVSSTVTFNNTSGTIAGGGGGGGGGAGIGYVPGCCGLAYFAGGGGGGGGRSSNVANSPGGVAGGACKGTNGTAGTYTAAGTGGNGGSNKCGVAYGYGGRGGNGGTWGATGSTGNNAGRGGQSPGTGGAGGKATCGAGTYITWTGTGTRYGSIS